MGEEGRWGMDGWRGKGNRSSDIKIIIIAIIKKKKRTGVINNFHAL